MQRILTYSLILATCLYAEWPRAPFFDLCVDKTTVAECKDNCAWFEASYPACFDKNFQNLYPPPGYAHQGFDFVTRAFTFTFGVHLTEGSIQQTYYNYNVLDCATACLNAPLLENGGQRCLSFDFYPFDTPQYRTPYFETSETGICMLNTKNQYHARLRSEDEGLTDAELFYRTNPKKRVLNILDGYYEVRDPRGGGISLSFDEIPKEDSPNYGSSHIWPQSRWGISHFSKPTPIEQIYHCDGPTNIDNSTKTSDQPYFKGGYTPINLNQHCPGKMRKTDATNLCASTGGFLCSTQADLLKLSSLGCNLDNSPSVWADSDPDNGNLKFVRCCAKYQPINLCDNYGITEIQECESLNTLSKCIAPTSISTASLALFRNNCRLGTGPCKGLVKSWSGRSNCVYCEEQKQCRPGNDLGICPKSPEQLSLFSTILRSQCNQDLICTLANYYPELGKGFSLDTYTARPTSSPFFTLPPTNSLVVCGELNQVICSQNSVKCKWLNGKCVMK